MGLQPAREPETVAASFKSNSNAIDVPPGFRRFIPPAVQQPQQRLLVRFEFLQRVAVDPRNDPSNQPTRETQFYYGDDRAILLEGDEGRVGRWNRTIGLSQIPA